MTCQTCLNWKRQGEIVRGSGNVYGYCYDKEAIRLHFDGTGAMVPDRMPIPAGHGCDQYEPKAIIAEAIEERAAIMEHDGHLPRVEAEQLAAEDVRRAMFREGRAR